MRAVARGSILQGSEASDCEWCTRIAQRRSYREIQLESLGLGNSTLRVTLGVGLAVPKRVVAQPVEQFHRIPRPPQWFGRST